MGTLRKGRPPACLDERDLTVTVGYSAALNHAASKPEMMTGKTGSPTFTCLPLRPHRPENLRRDFEIRRAFVR
jgi:hypothetical protein